MNSFRLTPLEVASGLVFGHTRVGARAGRSSAATPYSALKTAIAHSLRTGPCYVAFSGGRDSSAVLAGAADAARAEGLPLPIPITYRFPEAAGTDERAWQESVVAHLGLEDWLRPELTDELDIVGEIAQGVLLRHGLTWPFNAHFLVPALRLASGGTLLTGIGGDEILGTPRWSRAAAVLARRDRPEPSDLPRLAVALAPPMARRLVSRKRNWLELPWLHPDAQEACRRAWIATNSSEPLRWSARPTWSRGLRYLQLGMATLSQIGEAHGVRIAHPLTDESFVNAIAAAQPHSRFYDRTEAMRTIFGDRLPPALVRRSGKSHFDDVFWTGTSRGVAAGWSGEHVDEDLVDRERLRRLWAEPSPDARTFLLLQSVWLASRSDLRLAG